MTAPVPHGGGSFVCSTCGGPIAADEEHYPHQPDCQLGYLSYCTCFAPTHPDCCPECDPTIGLPR